MQSPKVNTNIDKIILWNSLYLHFCSKQVYQLFVRTLEDPGTVVVDNLSPSDKGELLVTTLKDKIGQLPSGCEFMCGSKKVILNSAFFLDLSINRWQIQ